MVAPLTTTTSRKKVNRERSLLTLGGKRRRGIGSSLHGGGGMITTTTKNFNKNKNISNGSKTVGELVELMEEKEVPVVRRFGRYPLSKLASSTRLAGSKQASDFANLFCTYSPRTTERMACHLSTIKPRPPARYEENIFFSTILFFSPIISTILFEISFLNNTF